MNGTIQGRKVAVLATDHFEQVELDEPVKALREAGAIVEIVAPHEGTIRGVRGTEPGDEVKVDREVSKARATDYAALVLPGGVANPDALRQDERAVEFVRTMIEMDKPVAAICHAPWMLVEADVVKGRTLTSYPSLQTDIRNAGGRWVDREVVRDEKLLTSRTPDDLPAFCSSLVELLDESVGERELDDMVEQTFPASDPLPPPSTSGSRASSREGRPEAR